MARLWSSGFESNTITANVEWSSNSGSPSIQTTTVRSGTYALQINSLSGVTAKRLLYQFKSSNNLGPFYARVYVNFATFPGAENVFFMLTPNTNGSATSAIRITVNNTGVLRLRNNSTQVGSASSALSTNTWYRIELKID